MDNKEFCDRLAAIRLRVEAERDAVTELCNEAPMQLSWRASYIADRLDIVLNEIKDVAAYAQK